MKKFLTTALAVLTVTGTILGAPMKNVNAGQIADTGVKYDHTTPTGNVCNNTYREYIHTGFSSSRVIGTHQLTNGKYCTISRLIYLHRVQCTGCGAVIYLNSAGECTEEHSLCGTHIVNEPYIGAN